MDPRNIFKETGLDKYFTDKYFSSLFIGHDNYQGSGDIIENISSVDGKSISRFKSATTNQIDEFLPRSFMAFNEFKDIPAPIRGKLVKTIAKKVEEKKLELARVITLEMGKTINEAEGEVQEWIDICDFAVGLSRQLTGLTIATERPNHRLMEQWHPIGPVLVISAFNFPMAVWAWNTMLGFVCGDSVVWKPSEETPLCALACHKIVMESIKELNNSGIYIPEDIHSVYIAGREESKEMVSNPIFPLVSATGSIPMGRDVAQNVAKRLGRSLLELGGNNAMIISKEADIELASRAAVFSAAGTTGQRCTSLRRLITHDEIQSEVVSKIITMYKTLKIGDPFDNSNFMGPLVNKKAYDQMIYAIESAKSQGGELLYGGERKSVSGLDGGYYVTPAVIKINHDAEIVQEETFAPILYVLTYENLEDAIDINNNVPQGLSSSIFSNNMREVEKFMSASGSDCGLVNVNVGTSGAEIGGAFGGEKETGGGRESGSDSWKNYMRRTTNTINYSSELPLAQGVKFDV